MSNPAPRRATALRGLRGRILELGALRITLLAAVAVLVASSLFASPYPFGDGGLGGAEAALVTVGPSGAPEVDFEIGVIWPKLIAPPLAVMLVFVVPLDMLMTRVYMSGKQGAERARYRRILIAEGAALVLLVAAWTPFFTTLLDL